MAGISPRHLRTASVADSAPVRQAVNDCCGSPYTDAPFLHRVRAGEGRGITTAVVVAALGAICVAGVLVAFWLASRRPVDARIATALDRVDDSLVGLTERIEAASARPIETRLAPRHDRLDDRTRTRSCTGRLPPRARCRRLTAARSACGARTERSKRRPTATSDPSRRRSSRGLPTVRRSRPARRHGTSKSRARCGPASSSRSGTEGPGTLAVYSRKVHAFDEDSVTLLAAIARHAAPAIQNAFRFLDVQELAATDLRTGLRSALAFSEELPREVSAARRHGRPLCMIQVDLDDFGSDQQDVLAGDRRRRSSPSSARGSARRFAAGTPPTGTRAAQTSSS